MQIVLDTNVLVSGLLSATGPPGRIVEAALAGHVQLVFDMAIRREYEDVLRRPELALPRGRVDDLFATIDEFGHRVAAAPPWSTGLPDPNDAMFLAVAAATANVLVTGNIRHFPQPAVAGSSYSRRGSSSIASAATLEVARMPPGDPFASRSLQTSQLIHRLLPQPGSVTGVSPLTTAGQDGVPPRHPPSPAAG